MLQTNILGEEDHNALETNLLQQGAFGATNTTRPEKPCETTRSNQTKLIHTS